MTGRPCSSAIALPRPIAEPPPTATQPSAPSSAATWRARWATSIGTCMRASGRTPAARAPSAAATARPVSSCSGEHRTSTRVSPEGGDLVGQRGQGPGAEHDPHGQRLVGEGRDHDGAPGTATGCGLVVPQQGDVEVHRAERVGQPDLGGPSRVVDLRELADQALLDPEDGVGVDVRVAGDEQVRGHRPVARGSDEEVHVRRPVGVPAGRRRAARPTGPSSGIG